MAPAGKNKEQSAENPEAQGLNTEVACHTCTTTAKITTKLQNNYHQDCHKIKLYGSPTTKELKKSHSSRWVGGAEMHRDAEWAVPPHMVDKNWEQYLRSEDPSPTPDHPAKGSSDRKISPHNFWL